MVSTNTKILSNEELAILIQSGYVELKNRLWEQVKRLVYKIMLRYYNTPEKQSTCDRVGVTWEDIEQESYFVLDKVINDYSPEKGYKFNSYLDLHCRNIFNNLIGIKTEKQRQQPLNNSTSLNIIIGENESTELGELQEDLEAQRQFDYVEHDVYTLQAREELLRAMGCKLNDQQREIIDLIYFKDMTYRRAGKELNITGSRVGEIRNVAIDKLRNDISLQNFANYKMIYFCDYKDWHLYQSDILKQYGYNGTNKRFKIVGDEVYEYMASLYFD